jgi:predicted ATPase
MMLIVNRLKGHRALPPWRSQMRWCCTSPRLKGHLLSDGSRLRAMAELQSLHCRVKDYLPAEVLSLERQQLMRLLQRQRNVWRPIRTSGKKELMRIISDKDLGALNRRHGLLLNGGVEIGKTMLVDMFSHSLPKQSKQRWHYQNFML